MSKFENTIELDNPLMSKNATSGHVKVRSTKMELDLDIPVVDINDALRTVICNSKVKINPYNIAKNNGYFDISPENIKVLI